MLERSVGDKCCREVLTGSVVYREVLLGEECCREVLERSVVEKCWGRVLWRKECCGEGLLEKSASRVGC